MNLQTCNLKICNGRNMKGNLQMGILTERESFIYQMEIFFMGNL